MYNNNIQWDINAADLGTYVIQPSPGESLCWLRPRRDPKRSKFKQSNALSPPESAIASFFWPPISCYFFYCLQSLVSLDLDSPPPDSPAQSFLVLTSCWPPNPSKGSLPHRSHLLPIPPLLFDTALQPPWQPHIIPRRFPSTFALDSRVSNPIPSSEATSPACAGMSISVQELDNTVRALFEGKGAVVSLKPSTLPSDCRIHGFSPSPLHEARGTITLTFITASSKTKHSRLWPK